MRVRVLVPAPESVDNCLNPSFRRAIRDGMHSVPANVSVGIVEKTKEVRPNLLIVGAGMAGTQILDRQLANTSVGAGR
jgi:hypothetical protein